MHYLLMLTAAPDAWSANEPNPDDGVIDDWALYTRALHAAGVLVAGHGLQGNDTATTVRVSQGRLLLTDGPFTESKEHLIGYYVLDAPDLDVAVAWAARAPCARIGSVEIRPVLPGSSVAETLAAVAG